MVLQSYDLLTWLKGRGGCVSFVARHVFAKFHIRVDNFCLLM